MAFVDRPLADFLEAHFRHTEPWIWLDTALRPLDLVIVGVLLFLVACGVLVLSGHQLRNWTTIPLLCCWSVMWAVCVIVFKHVFGRGWPDPTYLQNRLYGFHWLHGVRLRDSFPSGTAAVSTAIASVLWIASPRSRIGGLLVVIALSGAVVITNYHWLSDVFAGAFLGVSTGGGPCCFGRSEIVLPLLPRTTFP